MKAMSSRSRQRLVVLLLVVHKVLMDVSADDNHPYVQKFPLESVENHSNNVDNEVEKARRDVGSHSLSHAATGMDSHRLPDKAKDLSIHNSTDTASHNFTHTPGENSSNQSINFNEGDRVNKNSVHRRDKSALQNDTYLIKGDEKLGNFSQRDPYITVKTSTINQNMQHTESNSENKTMREYVPRNNEHNLPSVETQKAGGAKTVGRVKATIKDWFLELAKRINRPSWMMTQPDMSASASRNQTRPLSGHSKDASYPTNNSFFNENHMANGGNNLTQHLSEMGQSESLLEKYQDELLVSVSAPKQGSGRAAYKSLDNKTKDDIGDLLGSESLNQETSDLRRTMSEQTELPAVDNSTTFVNFLEDEFFKSSANDVQKATEDLDNVSNSSECPSCRKHNQAEELIRNMRLKMFKNLLVQKLRWDPVTLSENSGENIPIIPESWVEETLRDNAKEYERDEFHARDQEIIIAGEDMGRDCIKLHVTGCYSFQLKGRIRDDVAEAQLWLYKMEDASDVVGQTLTLYELERLKSGRLYHSSMIASRDTVTKQGWVEMNVTRSLMKWVDKRKGTKLIAIRCVTCTTRGHRALYGAKHGYKPLLIIKYVKDSHLLRGKRSTSCDPRYECCKLDLLVNFQDIGMSHILQPRQLSVGYCFGECNENPSYTSNHTVIRQRVRWSQPLASQQSMNQQLKPCCVPAILKDIFIMTSDGDGSIVRKLLPKVVVETCGCM